MDSDFTSQLHATVAAVAPVVGVGVPDRINKATWRIDFDPSATAAQQAAAQTALQNFDPNGVFATADNTYKAALAAGLITNWTISTALNDTYALDSITQIRMLTERVSVAVNNVFTNGTNTLTWYSYGGAAHTMTMAQAGAFAKAVWQYLTALWVALNTAKSGGTPSWPSNSVTINL